MKIFDEKGLRDALDGLQGVAPSKAYEKWLLTCRAHRFWRATTIVVMIACLSLHMAVLLAELDEFALAAMLVAMFPLALLILVSLGRMLIASGVGQRILRRVLRGNILGSLKRSRVEVSTLVAKTPAIAKVGLLLVGAYWIFNFYAFLHLGFQRSSGELEEASRFQDGKFVLVTTATPEFRHREQWDVRALSGNLVCFSLAVSIGFRYWVEHRPWDAS
jgi:hypothetical protein